MYEETWQNISGAEDAIWKVMAAYTAVLAATALASTAVGTWGFALIMSVFGFLGMAVCLNANWWFVRNIGLVSNLEQHFLHDSDYDRILPRAWKSKVGFLNFEVWWTLILLFIFVTAAVVGLVGPTLPALHANILYLVTVLGAVGVAVYGAIVARLLKDFKSHAPGEHPPAEMHDPPPTR